MPSSPPTLSGRPSQSALDAATLEGADLRGLALAGLRLAGRDLRGASLIDADLGRADLTGACLDGADLSDCELHGANFTGASLKGTILRRARGAEATFSRADLTGADLTGATCPKARLDGAILRDARADDALLQGVRAAGADLTGLSAQGAALDLADLRGANLSGAALHRATIEGADLTGARLDGATLTRARLDRARLDGARLVGADLGRARLNGATVAGADLDGVKAAGLGLSGVLLDDAQRAALVAGGVSFGPSLAQRALAACWAWIRGGGPIRVVLGLLTALGWPLRTAVGLGERAWGAISARRSARGAVGEVGEGSLAPERPGARALGRAMATRALGSARELMGLVGRRAAQEEFRPGVDLTGRDLRGADLRGLDLSGAILQGAFLMSTDLSGAILRGARLDGARLRGANLSGADLREASLNEVIAEEVDLRGADLRDARLSRARLQRADLRGAAVRGLIARDADLTGARLIDLDLDGVDLAFALLDQAELTGASLDGASVEGAELGGALGLSPAALAALRARGADVGGLGVDRETILRALRAVGGGLRAAATGAAQTLQTLARGALWALSQAPGLTLRVGRGALQLGRRGLSAAQALARLARESLAAAREAAQARVEARRRPVETPARDLPTRALEGAQSRFERVSAWLGRVGAAMARAWREGLRREGLGDRLRAWLRAAPGRLAASLHELRDRAPDLLRAALAQAPGLVTLVAAVALTGYLAGRFLSVQNLPTEAVEAEAVQSAARGEINEALERYEALLEASDKGLERSLYRYEIAAILLAEGRRDEALAQLRLGVEDAGDDPDARAEARLRLAEGHRAVGDFAGEREVLTVALTDTNVEPALTARALAGLYDAAERLGEGEAGEAAVAAYLAAPRSVSLNLSLRVRLAELIVSRGDYDRALAILDGASELPLDAAQRATLLAAFASAHEARGALAESLRAYTELISRYPSHLGSDGQRLLSAASVAARRGEVELARRWLDELTRRGAAPRVEAQATLLEGRLEREAGRPNTAALLFREVIERFPDDREVVAAAQLALAETLWATDDAGAAEALYAELLASGDAELVAQVQVGRARIHQRRGEADLAREVYTQVIEAAAGGAAARAAYAGLAELEIEEGRPNEALRALRALQASGEDGLTVDVAIADALLRSGSLDEAELAYTSLTRLADPTGEAALTGQLGLARVAEARGDLNRARAGYELVVSAPGVDPAVLSQALGSLAGVWVELGRDDEALGVYRRALQSLPEGHAAIFDVRLAMARILQARGEFEAAQAQVEALLPLYTTPARQAELRVSLAELTEARGDAAAALAMYQTLLGDDRLPIAQRDDVLVGLVRCTLAAGDAEGAVALAERWEPRALEESTRATLVDLRAQALRALGRLEEAEALTGAVEEEVDPLTVGMNEASALLNQGQLDEAIARYEALLVGVDDPATAAALRLSIAQALGDAGRHDEARAAFSAVLAASAQGSEAAFNAEMGLAWLLRLEGRPGAAATRYAALTAPDAPSDIWRGEQLAQAYLEAGQPDRAAAAYKSLLRARPDDLSAQATAKMGLATIHQGRGELTVARALYEQAARQSPDPSQREQAALRAALLLVDEGRLDDAETRLRALAEATEDPELRLQARIGLSSVLLERGNAGRALSVLDDEDAASLGVAWVVTLTQQRAACLIASGDPEDAEALWRAVLSEWSSDPDAVAQARLALADLALGQRRAEEAEGLYRAALEGSEDRYVQARAILGVGQAIALAGRAGEAQVLYERLIREYPEQSDLVEIAQVAQRGRP